MDHDGYVAFIESCNQPDVSKVSDFAFTPSVAEAKLDTARNQT